MDLDISKPTPNHMDEVEYKKALREFNSLYVNFSDKTEKALEHLLTFSRFVFENDLILMFENSSIRYPRNEKIPSALAAHFMRLGDFDKAIHWIDKALGINPNNEINFINKICWIAGRCEDPVQVKSMFETWGRRFADPLTALASPLKQRHLAPNRRLKVGYVSGDLKNHSVRYFIEPFFKGHDRSAFELHAFMTMAPDQVTTFLKPLVENWHDVKNLNDAGLLTLIRELEIDILVDLSGHTEGQRLAVFAQRAAPVQVTWFGFMQTLGMKAMDWRLTDWATSPPGSEQNYTEKLYRLDCMAAYAPPLNCETQYPSPHHSNGYVTMVSMNNTRKLGDQALEVWRDILLSNPNSGLMFIGSDRDAERSHASIAPRLMALGYPMERVSIAPRLTMIQFMNLASIADFALDSFPISGGTTTFHALWMGLPILGLDDPERGGMSSSTANTLRGLQFEQCVAKDLQDYLNIASSWINNSSVIDELRSQCRPALESCAMMDHSARVAEVENAYRFMWNDYVATATGIA